jgi:pyruvate-formate lyase
MEGTAGLSKNLKNERSWRDFKPGHWCSTIDVRDFIVRNVTPYEGDETFLSYAMSFPSMTIVKVVAVQVIGLRVGTGAC